MLRNLEKNVIFRAVITKKILPKNKNKRFILNFTSCFRVSLSAQAIVQIFGRIKMVPFPFMSQRYYQFSRFILQYNKIHHIQSTYQLIRRHVERLGSVFWQSTYGKLQYLINKQKLMKSSCLDVFIYLLYLKINQPCNIHLLLFK